MARNKFLKKRSFKKFFLINYESVFMFLPVGRWTILTALSVVLTCWPPAPLALLVSILRSLGFIVKDI